MSREPAREVARIRARIDAVDDAIVARLARRRALAAALGRVKKASRAPIYDRRRERALLGRVAARAAARGLEPRFVAAVFRLIVANSKDVQRDASR